MSYYQIQVVVDVGEGGVELLVEVLVQQLYIEDCLLAHLVWVVGSNAGTVAERADSKYSFIIRNDDVGHSTYKLS